MDRGTLLSTKQTTWVSHKWHAKVARLVNLLHTVWFHVRDVLENRMERKLVRGAGVEGTDQKGQEGLFGVR